MVRWSAGLVGECGKGQKPAIQIAPGQMLPVTQLCLQATEGSI